MFAFRNKRFKDNQKGPSFEEFIIASNIKSMYREALKECSQLKDIRTRKEMKEYLRNEFKVAYTTPNKDYLMATLRQTITILKTMIAQVK